MATQLRVLRITATGVLRTTGTAIKTVVLTPASALSTLVLRNGGAAGPIICSLQAAPGGSSVVLPFSGDDLPAETITAGDALHATIAGLDAIGYVYTK